MFGHETHVSIGEDYRAFIRVSDFHQWLIISCRIDADRNILGFFGPNEEDAA